MSRMIRVFWNKAWDSESAPQPKLYVASGYIASGYFEEPV